MIKVAALVVFLALTATALTRDELDLLQDPAGWKYMTITDADNGFETQHVCFAPSAPGQCSGNLLFRSDNTFKKTMHIHGEAVDRSGTYQVDGDSILFLDEFNNKDGPYSVQLNKDANTLVLESVQAGVHLRMELLLEKEFRRRQQQRKKTPGH